MRFTISCLLRSLVLMLVACDDTSECDCAEATAACNIDTQVMYRSAGLQLVDCGNLPRLADSAARAAADRCVLDAQSAQRPFKLISWMQGIDSNIAYGYISPRGPDANVSILEYDSAFSQFSSTGGGSIGIRTCSSLREVASCQPDASTFCLECVDEGELSKVCEEPAR